MMCVFIYIPTDRGARGDRMKGTLCRSPKQAFRDLPS